MSRIILTRQAVPPSPPSATKAIAYLATPNAMAFVDDQGINRTLLDNEYSRRNFSIAAQAGFAADTYLIGSMIPMPVSLPIVGSTYYCVFDVTKTAAGVAAPTVIVRFGINGTTADTARLTFTFGAGSAVIDNGTFELWVRFRVVGASAVLQGLCQVRHGLAATGITSTGASGCGTLLVTSGAFDSTIVNSKIGLSVNGGAAAAWTTQLVQTEFSK